MNIFKYLKRKSILIKISMPMLVVMILQTLVIFGVFIFGGAFATLNQNEIDILSERVKNRQEFVQTEMVERWANVDSFVSAVNSNTAAVLSSHSVGLSQMSANFNDFGGSFSLAEIIIRSQCDDLISFLLRSVVDGAFIILDSGTGTDGRQHGVYIGSNRTDTGSTSDLMIKVAQQPAFKYLSDDRQITNSNLELSFAINQESDGEFFFKPLNLAKTEMLRTGSSTNAKDYGYWARPFRINQKGNQLITYTVPLIYQKQVYGVLGIEVSVSRIQNMLPHREVKNSSGSYLLAVDTVKDLNFKKVTSTGAAFTRIYGTADSISAQPHSTYNNNYIFTSDAETHANGEVYGCIEYFRLYNANSPFAEDSWALIGIIEKDVLFSFTNQMRLTFIITGCIAIVIGIICVIITSAVISMPILRLTEKVRKTESNMLLLDRTKIYEIDQLVGEIEKLSNNISQLEKIEKNKLEFERDHDVLTQLTNRRGFEALFKDLADNPQKIKKAALIMIDLDDLKYLNDMYGHDAGDEYLKTVAVALKKYESSNVVVARIAGDEFFVFIYGVDESEQINDIIEKIKEEIKSCTMVITEIKETFPIRCSAGVARYPDDTESLTQLIEYADSAMYSVKRTIKNNFKEYSEL